MKRLLPIAFLATLICGAYWAANQPDSSANTAVPPSDEPSHAPVPAPEETKEPNISVRPGEIIQGEAVLVSVKDLGAQKLESLSFDGKKLRTFMYNGSPSALIGMDLRMKTGTYPLVATLSGGQELDESIKVSPRVIETAPLGIPEKLGGNTEESEQELVNTLVEEAAIMNAIPSGDEKLWDGAFRYPIDPPVVITDTYGYSRQTGGSSISHKGTDFRAAIGTPVYAMNSGQVRFTDFMRNYGYTIVIDHGLGLHTVYMHLSKILVENGQMVEKGQLIGKSGDTGYVTGPHLHLSVRINAVSIDPMKFMELFGN
jgi:hypothetical protein